MPKPSGGRGANDRDLFHVLRDNSQIVDGKHVFQQPLARLARLAKLSPDQTRRLLSTLEGKGAVQCVKAIGGPDKLILDDQQLS